ncbi:acyl-CoA dehydrogenase family protein [Nocardia harenae]|uniref:acyl-CoA dehydrogenase family protein n=1 Tax=Nocardia harenae TaxID=358707 RepID=UPI0008317367|nr:acyl-CoA dehydrogenase family protein [Nocardia harenae]
MTAITSSEAVETWLKPLQPLIDPASRVDWPRLAALAAIVDDAAETYPIVVGLGRRPGDQLHAIRIELANHGLLDTTRQPALFAVLAQFVCGYRDIDMRDSTGLGHGALVARYGGSAVCQHWIPRLLAGELAGIAITEAHGGSNPTATATRAVSTPDGTWRVTGSKSWISRLSEAAVFMVFFRAPDGGLAAAAVDAGEPSLHRRLVEPAGLAGWDWGILDLDRVPIRPEDVLRGDGMTLLRSHFARYRPLVTATAAGAAAALFDMVTATLADRHTTGGVPRLRDTALLSIGRAHAQLVSALLGAAASAALAESGYSHAERWSAGTKSHGVDLANQVAADLMPLVGAAGFRADSPLIKIRRDLGGLLYADGIHDSLYRASGKQHITHAGIAPSSQRPASQRLSLSA